MELKHIITDEEAGKIRELLDGASHIVVTCHTNPDGDAMGSMTAMVHLLERLGHQAVAVAPDRWPDNLLWLPGADKVQNYAKQKEEVDALLKEADLVFLMDHNQLNRMNELGEAVAACPAKRVMIDHHPDPDREVCEVVVSQPSLCAAAEVLYRLMDQMGWAEGLTYDEATCLYAAMMTDTGGFTFASNRPEVFLIVSRLLETGIDKDKIYRNVFFTGSSDRYRMMGYLLYVKMEVMRDLNAAVMSLTAEERRMFKIRQGETDGFVNLPLQIERMRLSIFLREDTERKGVVRVSLRSVDDFPCNEMSAEFFNGGGHRNASGGTIYGTMDEALELVRKAIRKYAPLLKN